MLGQDITERMEGYALGHCPFTGPKIWEQAEFELTKTTRGEQSPDLAGIWYVHVWLTTIQQAYGLFVAVWRDGNAGGVIEPDGMQRVFEYHPSQTLPIERNWRPHWEDSISCTDNAGDASNQWVGSFQVSELGQGVDVDTMHDPHREAPDLHW